MQSWRPKVALEFHVVGGDPRDHFHAQSLHLRIVKAHNGIRIVRADVLLIFSLGNQGHVVEDVKNTVVEVGILLAGYGSG